MKIRSLCSAWISLLVIFGRYCSAFLLPGRIPNEAMKKADNYNSFTRQGPASFGKSLHQTPVVVPRQRQSVSRVWTMGLFGLGVPEIAIICVAAAFVIGPDNLGKFLGEAKSGFDDLPDDIKKIPEEFQKGVEEGEANARARNAKVMEAQERIKDREGE